MDEIDHTELGNAYPAAATGLTALHGQASWNPALRPNVLPLPDSLESHREPADDTAFDRYPGDAPGAQQTADLGEVSSPSRSQFDKDDLETASLAVKGGEEQPGQELSKEIVAPHTAQETPAAHYEHQSELTALEEAIDEDVRAPLMEDEQPEPEVAIIGESTAPSAAFEPPAGPERSFTTNFTTIAEPTIIPQTAAQDDSWPAVGDDKTFADLLDDGHDATQTNGMHEMERPTVEQPTDGDMDAAAWAAALEDDDILIDTDETDPKSFFGVDDDDFLADDFDMQPLAPPPPQSAYLPASQPAQVSQSHLRPVQHHSRSAGTPETSLYSVFGQPEQSAPRPALMQTQSFVDKPRSDYQSPYDLPVDVVKPRKRPQTAVQQSQFAVPQPPPRTSSFGAPLSPVDNVSQPLLHDAGPRPPPSGIAPAPLPGAGLSATPRSAPAPDFFADLPVTAKSRARPSGAYSPQPQSLPGMSHQSQQQPPIRSGISMAPPQLRPTQSYAPPQTQQSAMAEALRQPEKAPLFPEQTTNNIQQASPPRPISAASANQGRYSPVAPVIPQPAPQSTRYSPAPSDPSGRKSVDKYSSSPSFGSGPPPSRQQLPFLPRTSSPLATYGRPVQPQNVNGEPVRSGSQYAPGSPGKTVSTTASPDRRNLSRDAASTPPYRQPSIDTSLGLATNSTFRPSQPFQPAFSPNNAMPGQNHLVNGSTLPSGPTRLPHRRQFSKDLPFSAPNDERVHDVLQRWRGHAIFQWSNGGFVTSSIPRQTPFYAAGSHGPSIKCTPGDVKIVEASQVLPLPEIDAKFPGPLAARSKSKKKELVAWLGEKIGHMMQAAQSAMANYALSEPDRVAADEKLVLWRVMQVFLENDGDLSSSPKTADQIRNILLPDLAQKAQVAELQSPTSRGRGASFGDMLDTAVINQIRQALFEGRREDAVRLAEEKRLWGHAMLIASTMDPENFRQIISSFVRSQVKSQGGSEFRSLASLYQVFAGSPEDCVDELVPPSARAGFQMINTADGQGSGEALGGLDQWRETLSLVHSNPTPHNAASIVAIGRLLKSYGRVEAAHTCFVFARALAKHSGADDADADFVLLGADASNGVVDLDSLMLSEILEFATSLSTPSNQWQYVPHLQAYKMLHGQILAAHGQKSQAQQYCDHVDSAIKATTRPSGYFHQAFAQELIKFNEYLSQSPHTGAGGGKFFSRPAIGKVSSGVGSWFTKFVSGDEGDTDSNASGQGGNEGEVFGPFGGVSANSMPISRTTSTTELHNPAITAGIYSPPIVQPATMPSRYTPLGNSGGSKYAPMASTVSVGSFDSERSVSLHAPSYGMPSAEPIRSASARYAPASAGTSPALLAVQGNVISRRASNQSLISNGSYEPRPALAEHDGFGYSQSGENISSPALNVSQSGGATFDDQPRPAMDDYIPNNEQEADYESSYVPPSMTYEPPADEGPEIDEETAAASTATIRRNRSIMDDDDDDLVSRAAALSISQPDSSRGPDPAVVAAAQADAARAAAGQNNRQSGWFGGWFGKKDPNAMPGPVKAKLGEESSFYFDKDLNKWVNKKAGADAASASAPTPPPPRAGPGPASVASTPPASGPPSRNVSRTVPVANGPPSRQATPANALPVMDGATPRAISSNAEAGPGSMGPPARPASSMSNASNLDDLLGNPGAGRKAGAAKAKKKGGRYVDVMASAK